MLTLRLSDGYSMAEIFYATDEASFVAQCARAFEALRARYCARHKRPLVVSELHVQLANGDWIAPTYRCWPSETARTPNGQWVSPNTPVHVSGSPELWLWTWAKQARDSGDRFTGALGRLTEFVARDGDANPASGQPRR